MSPHGKAAQQAQAACREVLQAAGFRKRAGAVYTCELAPDVLGFVGLNSAANGPAGPYEINPVLGVRHQLVEQVVAELNGRQPHSYNPPTLSSPLGYLMPEARYRAWYFGDDETPEATAASLGAALTDYGVPFLRDHTTLSSIIEELVAGRHGISAQSAFRLPVAHQLAGEGDRARRVLEEEIHKLGDRADAASTYYRDFATAFHQRYLS